MKTDDTYTDLVQHLQQTRGMDPGEATRVLQEILSYFSETREEFVQRRHRELQGSGLPNAAIYQRLRYELEKHRFPAGSISERQIRRMIYG